MIWIFVPFGSPYVIRNVLTTRNPLENVIDSEARGVGGHAFIAYRTILIVTKLLAVIMWGHCRTIKMPLPVAVDVSGKFALKLLLTCDYDRQQAINNINTEYNFTAKFLFDII